MKLALLQFHSKSDKEQNLTKVRSLIEAAVEAGAELITLPETFNFRGKAEQEVENSEPILIDPLLDEQADYSQALGDSLQLIHELSKKHKVAILAGSILETITDYSYCAPKCKAKALAGEMSKAMNTSCYFNADGDLIAKYSKVHLFDTDFCFESRSRCHGAADSKNIRIWEDDKLALHFGIGICYDLRFPELFRAYSHGVKFKFSDYEDGASINSGSAELIFLPSAFSVKTGPDHWEPLLRARAIENSCYFVAPNQTGLSESGFDCHGESMVVDPWGRVLELEQVTEEIFLVDIDLALVRQIREKMPLSNIRFQ